MMVTDDTLDHFRTKVCQTMPSVDDLSAEEISSALLTFDSLVCRNIAIWIANIWSHCQNPYARGLCCMKLEYFISTDSYAELHHAIQEAVDRYTLKVANDTSVRRAARSAIDANAGYLRSVQAFCESDSLDGLWILAGLHRVWNDLIIWIDDAVRMLHTGNYDRSTILRNRDNYQLPFHSAIAAEAGSRDIRIGFLHPYVCDPLFALSSLLFAAFHVPVLE